MKNLKNLFFMCLVVSLAFLTACGDDDVEDPGDPNEEEVITTLTLTFTNGADVQTFTFRDADGDGGAAPTVEDITLTNGVAYTVDVTLLNESETPAENVTEEIEEEDDEHQFFFTGSAVGSVLTHAYGDMDDNMNPIGLTNTITTTNAGTGVLTVTLKHQPGIKTSTTGIGDGETDIAVDFNVTVQ